MANDEETEAKFGYGMYKSEGDHHFVRGLTTVAAQNYTKALIVKLEDPYALVARSQCHLKQGNFQQALDDVNRILKDDAENFHALYVKAEALYNKGHFEMALIFYHRGAKIKADFDEFRLGIQKAEQAIDHAVGDTGLVITTAGDLSFFQKEINEEKAARSNLKPSSEGSIKRKKVADEVDIRPKPLKASTDVRIRHLLGQLYGDRQFLDGVLREANRKTPSGAVVYNAAWDAIAYLDQRTDLWRQERANIMHGSVKGRRARRASTTTEKVKINNWITKELAKIDFEQNQEKWLESCECSIKLLEAINQFESGVVNNKEEIVATINSYIGNAMLELGEPRKALDYFKMERSLAHQFSLKESLSRALDNIGRTYVRMGWYKKAINIWNAKLQMAESPLERAWLYHEMGRCHYELHNFQRAKELGERTVAEATAADDKMWLLNGLILTAQALVQLEDFSGALDAFLHALEIAELLDDQLSAEAIRRAIDELNHKIVAHLKGRTASEAAIADQAGAGFKIDTEDVGVQTGATKLKKKKKKKSQRFGGEASESDDEEDDLDDELKGQTVVSRDEVRQAYVTLATNDVYAVGAMVLAFTLRQTKTKRDLVVMVTPEVTPEMHVVLESVFDLVFDVEPINSNDFGNLCLLNRSDLGITFTKIHCWRLTQYSKGVFLDADTIVLQNIDELFQRGELSAAPDSGWPDCFNSGVFVFIPSLERFNQLLEFARRVGSFDGGDQGLLNLFFDKWATEDIDKHLPFTYNLVAHAFYSYLPAYKQYGSQVGWPSSIAPDSEVVMLKAKVVHFIGPRKPWHFDYDPVSCKVNEAGFLCPHLIQLWWDIFINHIIHKLSRSMSGLVGRLAELQLRCVGVKLPDWIADRRRQFKWERNDIDYMGADSFENIRRRLDAVILGEEGTNVINAAISILTDAANSVRPEESFVGHFDPTFSDTLTGIAENSGTAWQSRALRPSPTSSATTHHQRHGDDSKDATESTSDMPKESAPLTADDRPDTPPASHNDDHDCHTGFQHDHQDDHHDSQYDHQDDDTGSEHDHQDGHSDSHHDPPDGKTGSQHDHQDGHSESHHDHQDGHSESHDDHQDCPTDSQHDQQDSHSDQQPEHPDAELDHPNS